MNNWKKSGLRILIAIVTIYLILCACAFVFQRSLIYFPTKIPANAVEWAAKEHGFVPWKNPAGATIGWRIPASGTATGSVLIVHGNAGCALNRGYIAQPIHDAADVEVFVLEYPGYGAREGLPSKASILAAAEEAFKLLPSGSPRYVVSESIGAGVAGNLAKRHPTEIAGLTLFVPYCSLASVAQKHMWFLPAYLFLLDRYHPAADLTAYHGPIQFVVAGADEILGPETGQKLYEGYTGSKKLELIAGAHHNEVAEQSPRWWRGVFEFWSQGKGRRMNGQ